MNQKGNMSDKMAHEKFYDFATTFLLAAVPIVLRYEQHIVAHFPPEYAIVVTIVLAVLCQFATEKRVKECEKEAFVEGCEACDIDDILGV